MTARLRPSATRHVAPAVLQRGMLHAAWSVSRNRPGVVRCLHAALRAARCRAVSPVLSVCPTVHPYPYPAHSNRVLQHPKDPRYAARHFFPYAGWLDAGEANKVPPALLVSGRAGR